MEYKNLREFIAKLKRAKELKTVTGADWNVEIGVLTLLSQKEESGPALLFDDIKDYPKGHRVLTNALTAMNRSALALGFPPGLKPVDYVLLCKELNKKVIPIKPVTVKDGPVLENSEEGKNINILKFPTPLWHEDDGGRYIGTGCVVINQDPDNGFVNLGTYRVMVHDEKTLGFYISPGKDGRIIREKYFSKGQPCKVAISFGHDPLILIAGSKNFGYGFSEYDWVGGVRGEPVEVINGPYSGLPIPASAEIVIEGESFPNETRMEGPFGEWTGYYASGERQEPVIHIKNIFYRHNPIILGEPPGNDTGPAANHSWKIFMSSAILWNEMEQAGISDIKGVYYPPAAGRLIRVISIKQRYPGHAKQAGLVATGAGSAAYMGRYTIVVDDDIDPTDWNHVTWALATRSDPVKSIDVVRRNLSSALDPIIPRLEKGLNSRAIIEACKPYEWIADFPKSISISEEWKDRYEKKWRKVLFDRAG